MFLMNNDSPPPLSSVLASFPLLAGFSSYTTNQHFLQSDAAVIKAGPLEIHFNLGCTFKEQLIDVRQTEF